MVELRAATDEDFEWLESLYQEVDFEPSNTETDTIVIAAVDGHRAGAGRLVHMPDGSAELGGIVVKPEHRGRSLSRLIVGDLIQRADDKTLYCLPFAKLQNLYASFGFERIDAGPGVPARLREKLDYCAGHYADQVILMRRDASA